MERVFTQSPELRHEGKLCNWELLRLRARAIGGTLATDSSESGGVRVTCIVKRGEGGGVLAGEMLCGQERLRDLPSGLTEAGYSAEAG